MADYGLIQGLAEGLRSGVESYRDTTRYNQDRSDKKRAYQLQLSTAGKRENPLTGALEDTEEAKAKREMESKLSNVKMDEARASTDKTLKETGLLGKPKVLSPLEEAEKGYKEAETRKILAGLEGSKNGIGPLTEGDKAADKDFAKTYNEWNATGKSTLEKNLNRLELAKKALADDSSLTGSVRGILPDWIRNTTNEKAIRTRDDVRAAAQGALKQTLGAQFTEKEGERIMNQAYNEKLSPQANIAKIQAAIDELSRNRDALDTESKHFEKFGTLKGWNQQGLIARDVPPEPGSISKTAPVAPKSKAPTMMVGKDPYEQREDGLWYPTGSNVGQR